MALPLARRELARWWSRAHAITDTGLREIALGTLRDEHVNSEGAAAFAVLHPPAAKRLVPLLVAYQLAWDFVDTVLERPTPAAGSPEAVRKSLELAISIEDDAPPRPTTDDAGNGFLRDLVYACRAGCVSLPTYEDAQPALRRAAARSQALLLTNGPPDGEPPALTGWAAGNWAEGGELGPVELCAAGQCSLGVHALLAAAARPSSRGSDFAAIEAAYYPWIDALCTMLDSLVDQADDARTGDFSFISQYPSSAYAGQRLRLIADRSLRATHALPAASRHRALVSAVVGMYLSTPSAQAPSIRPIAEGVLDATSPFSRWARAVADLQRRSRP